MIPGSDTRVDAYIDALPDWQQVICRRVRELIHAADPDVTETIKRTTQPYFVLEGNVCALDNGHHPGARYPAETAGRLTGDCGDKLVASIDIDDDFGHHLARRDRTNGARELVAGADLHVRYLQSAWIRPCWSIRPMSS